MSVNNLKLSFKEHRRYWYRLLLNAVLLVLLFYGFYYGLKNIQAIDDIYVEALNKFAKLLLIGSKFLTEFFGFEVTTYGKTIKIVDDFKASGIYLDRGCMGRNVMIGFAGLIAVFPGVVRHKIWFIPMGLALLTATNMIRISGLAITAYCCPEYSDVNHYFWFKLVAWIIIFLLWIWWFNRFALKELKKKPS